MSDDPPERPRGTGKFRHSTGKIIEIRDVWRENLEKEMSIIRELVMKYPFIAMDTEFPGIVARPVGDFNSHTEYRYQTMRCNVDILKIIQLGISFADDSGNIPDHCPCWQFNFKFDLGEDMFAQDSIDLLKRSGIDFEQHQNHGIDISLFGELLMSSGLVLLPEVKWISFHSGYDFGYLLKLLTCRPLPAEEKDFIKLLHTYFPCVYDIKQLLIAVDSLNGGLNKVAADLSVERVGPMHQAGSDSLLTSAVFFALRDKFLGGQIDDDKYKGALYGLTNQLSAK